MSEKDLAPTLCPLSLSLSVSVAQEFLVTAPASSIYVPRETFASRSINFVKKKSCWNQEMQTDHGARQRLEVWMWHKVQRVLEGSEFKADLSRSASLGGDDEMSIPTPKG